MAYSLNKVTIMGTLGQDPKVTPLKDNKKVVSLSVATSERWKDKTTGEKKEKTEWHRISVFGELLTKVAESYLRKGSRVYIEGQLQTRSWKDESGIDKYSTEIVLTGFEGKIILLDRKLVTEDTNFDVDASVQDIEKSETKKDFLFSVNEKFDDEIPF